MAVEERIANACVRAGRSRSSLRLMAVSKLQPAEKIVEAAAHGMRLFGESRVQETLTRRDVFPSDGEVHLIGHLQRNKARDAASLYHTIQSIDAARTVEAIAPHIEASGAAVTLYIEVNTSHEESKFGLRTFEEVYSLARRIEELPRFALRGLMTIGPFIEDRDRIRRAFAQLREFRDRLEERMSASYPELSMGMSDDLEEAVQEGSTMLRIGTAIFGSRDT